MADQGALYIFLLILITALLTFLLYAGVPLLAAAFRKKPTTSKQWRTFIIVWFIVCYIALFLYYVYEEADSTPNLLWLFIWFYVVNTVGTNILRKRGCLIEKTAQDRHTPSDESQPLHNEYADIHYQKITSPPHPNNRNEQMRRFLAGIVALLSFYVIVLAQNLLWTLCATFLDWRDSLPGILRFVISVLTYGILTGIFFVPLYVCAPLVEKISEKVSISKRGIRYKVTGILFICLSIYNIIYGIINRSASSFFVHNGSLLIQSIILLIFGINHASDSSEENDTHKKSEVVSNRNLRFTVIVISVIALIVILSLVFLVNDNGSYSPLGSSSSSNTSVAESQSAAPTPTAAPEQTPVPNGTIFLRPRGQRPVSFSVKAPKTSDCYVVLYSLSTLKTAMTFYVQAGERAEVDVPLGHYVLYYAVGAAGTDFNEESNYFVFGKNTTWFTMDDAFEFTEDETGYGGWTVVLQDVNKSYYDAYQISFAELPF